MKALFSYILSTMAGLCLVGGITVVTIQTDEEEYEDE